MSALRRNEETGAGPPCVVVTIALKRRRLSRTPRCLRGKNLYFPPIDLCRRKAMTRKSKGDEKPLFSYVIFRINMFSKFSQLTKTTKRKRFYSNKFVFENRVEKRNALSKPSPFPRPPELLSCVNDNRRERFSISRVPQRSYHVRRTRHRVCRVR